MTCSHEKIETVVYGVTRCRKCRADLHPTRVTSFRIDDRHVLAHGDPCRVAGIGRATFYYVDEDRGGTFVHVKREFGGTANVTPDRIRPAHRRDVTR
jgi:hypothetical protein